MNKNNEYLAREYTFSTPRTKVFSSSGSYTVLFISSGWCTCHFDNQSFYSSTEDMILIRPRISVSIEHTDSPVPLRFFQICFTPDLLNRLSNSQTNLEKAFQTTPFTCVKIPASSQTSMMLKNLCRRLLTLPSEDNVFASSLFQDSLLTMFLVLLLRACIHAELNPAAKLRSRLSLDDIFIFIREHLHEEISLDRLEKEFFISKYHISREFKKQTGMTVHRYIVKSRLERCKMLLANGMPVMEIYKICGFGTYNHLFRAFKQEFGITPKEFVAQLPDHSR